MRDRAASRGTRAIRRRLEHRLSTLAGERTWSVPLVVRQRTVDQPLEITPATQLVIEGFPRSGNSFAASAFRHAQGDAWVRTSHHVHAPAQVVRAVQLGIPTLVLVRRPEDAVLSNLVFFPYLSARGVLRDWIGFYERVVPVLDSVVVATFDDVTSDFGAVTDAVNRRFGTSFAAFDHTAANVDAVHSRSEDYQRELTDDAVFEARVPRPSALREATKDARRAELDHPRARVLMARADALYATLLARRHTA